MSESPDCPVTTQIDDMADLAGDRARTEIPDLHLSDSDIIARLRTSGTTTSPGASDEDN
jgi:hypothetical protein